MAKKLKVKSEFQQLVLITDKELKQLEKSCIEKSKGGENIQVIVWHGTDIVIGGMYELLIATENNLIVEVKEENFDSEYQVKEWIVNMQFGGKVLSIMHQNYLVGKLYNDVKLDKNKNLKSQKQNRQNGESIKPAKTKTAKILAAEYKMGERTVERNGRFATCIDELTEKYGEGFKRKVLTREVPINSQDIFALTKSPDEVKNLTVDKLINGGMSYRDASFFAQDTIRKKEAEKAKYEAETAMEKENTDENSSPIKKFHSALGKLNLGSAPEFLKQLPDDCIDCVVTDPPYGVSYFSETQLKFEDEAEDAMPLLDATLTELKRVVKPDGHIYLFFAMSLITEVKAIIKKHFDLGNEIPLIWDKVNSNGKGSFDTRYSTSYEPFFFISNGKRKLNATMSKDLMKFETETKFDDILKQEGVLSIKGVPKSERIHACQKPVDLMGKLILNSTVENEVVLDCFAGSSATLIASKLLGRRFIGVEQIKKIHAESEKELEENYNATKYTTRINSMKSNFKQRCEESLHKDAA